MAEPFADDEYYRENFGAPPPAFEAILDQMLARASRLVRAEAPGVDERIEDGDLDAALVADIVCGMVKEAGPPVELGVTALQESAGPFQQSRTYANPTGRLFLGRDDRRRLGIGAQRAFTVSMAGDDEGLDVLGVLP